MIKLLEAIVIELRERLGSEDKQTPVYLEDSQGISDLKLLNFSLDKINFTDELVLTREVLLDEDLSQLSLTVLVFAQEMKVRLVLNRVRNARKVHDGCDTFKL